MRGDNEGGKSELSLGTSQDDDSAPGGGVEKSPLRELTDEEIQAVFARNNREGLGLLDTHRRLKIANKIFLGSKRLLTRDHDVPDAYQELMAGLCKTIVNRPGKIKNIIGYTYRAAWKRGAGAIRQKVRRERRVKTDELAVQVAAGRPDERLTNQEWTLAKMELISTIRNYLEKLEGVDAKVAECRFGDLQMTHEETASLVGKSVATVKRIQDKIRNAAKQLVDTRN